MPYPLMIRILVAAFSTGLVLAQAGCGSSTACTELPTAGASDGPAAGAAGGDVPLAEPIRAPRSLTVRSDDFTDGGEMPQALAFNGFGCTGDNRSPALAWTGAPAGTQSYAIIVHDPDAPTGVGFFHWLAYDIPAATTSLAAGGSTALPTGAINGRTDFGATGYGGPCPPQGSGPHRYVLTVYALDVPTLGLPAEGSGGAILRFMLAAHTIGYGRLVGTFAR